MKIIDRFDRFFLGGLKDLLVRIWMMLKFTVQFLIIGGKDIDELAKQANGASYDVDERRARYQEMISEHAPGEYESSIRNLMLFDVLILTVGVIFFIMGLFTIQAQAIVFGLLVFIFGILCLGYPIFIVRNKIRVSYAEFVHEIFKRGKIRQTLPSFNIQIRG